MLSYDNIELKLNNNIKHFLKKLQYNYLFYFVFLGFLYQVCALYPGLIYNDGWSQYVQAKGWIPLGDWHPPLMTWVWYLQLKIFDSYKIFYAINIFVFWFALYNIFRRISKGIVSGILTFITGTLPFFMVENGVVIKDIHLGIVILFIFSLLIGERKYFFKYFFIFILLVYCSFIRNNAVFLTAPLFVFIIFQWNVGSYLKYVYSLIVVLIVIAITPFVNHSLLKADDNKNILSLVIFDLAGISYRTGEQLFPIEIPNDVAAHLYKDCYTPNFWDTFASWSDKPLCKFYGQKIFSEDKPVNFFIHKWLEAIAEHPLAYVRHRLSAFDRFMNYTKHRPNTFVFYADTPGFGAYPGADGYERYDRAIYRFSMKFVNENNIWFAPYFWFSILIGIFIVSYNTKTRLERLINATSFAGCMYLLGFLFVGVAYGFRYAFPAVTLCTGLIIALFIHKRVYGAGIGSVKCRISASLFVLLTLLFGWLF